jgi:arylsulfatase
MRTNSKLFIPGIAAGALLGFGAASLLNWRSNAAPPRAPASPPNVQSADESLSIQRVAQTMGPAGAPTAGRRPNVVVIFSDDVGWGDLGSYGGGKNRGTPTPNLDRLAAEGVRFTNWYGQASCTAGRASFMTGRIPIRSALSVVIAPGDPNHLHKETPTIAEFYKKNGYTTYFSGKWHLGDTPEAYPIEHGFDEMKHFLAYYAGVYAYDNLELHPFFPINEPKFMDDWRKVVNDGEWEGATGKPPKRVVEHFGYNDLSTIDDQQAASAAAYIQQHAGGGSPFFMYLAFMKVHQPNNPSPNWKGKSHEGNYFDALMELDDNTGKVIDAIRNAKIENDTIVVWTTDNGPWVDAWPDAGYTPFRGAKGTAFEGGWRVPGIIWAPGRVPPGTVRDGMMSHVDIWPTTAALAGLAPPPHGEWKGNDGKPIYFDGIDNSAYVTGKGEQSARQSWVYIEGTKLLAVRVKEWKFAFTAKDAWLGPDLKLSGIPSVYNLQMDPGEQYDMTFNGAAPPAAGVLKTSPGRYSGADNGWTGAIYSPAVNELTATFKRYPNIATIPSGASIGSDLPEFVAPDVVAATPQK